jgi:hypothetical protein
MKSRGNKSFGTLQELANVRPHTEEKPPRNRGGFDFSSSFSSVYRCASSGSLIALPDLNAS